MNWILAFGLLGIMAFSVVWHFISNLLFGLIDRLFVWMLDKEFDKEMKKGKAWCRTPKYKALLHLRIWYPLYLLIILVPAVFFIALFIPIPTKH